MKTVILFGSPRRNGYTAELLEAFCAALPADTECIRYDAYNMNVQPCTGCGGCDREWFCPLSDDMEGILDAILQCDLLVIASPVYFLTFPSPLKAVLDRTQRCFAAHGRGDSPFLNKIRQTAVLLTAGAPSEQGEVVKKQLRWLLPPFNSQLSGMTVCPDTDRAGVTPEAKEQAAELARRCTER